MTKEVANVAVVRMRMRMHRQMQGIQTAARWRKGRTMMRLVMLSIVACCLACLLLALLCGQRQRGEVLSTSSGSAWPVRRLQSHTLATTRVTREKGARAAWNPAHRLSPIARSSLAHRSPYRGNNSQWQTPPPRSNTAVRNYYLLAFSLQSTTPAYAIWSALLAGAPALPQGGQRGLLAARIYESGAAGKLRVLSPPAQPLQVSRLPYPFL